MYLQSSDANICQLHFTFAFIIIDTILYKLLFSLFYYSCQYNEEKVKKMRLAKEEVNKKMVLLEKNSEKLNKLLQTLFLRTVSDLDIKKIK